MKRPWTLLTGAALASLFTLTLSAQETFKEEFEKAEPYKAASDKQLLTLGDAKSPRFELKEITYPAKPGDAEVCLWKDDKYAAASICIDDNCKPDHKFWIELCKKYDIKVTFFIITGKVGGRTTSGFSGTWDDWRAMQASGVAALQSHSVNHHKNDNDRSDDEVRYEYAAAKKTIETELPGVSCDTIATPWGRGKSKIANDYYIAVRGTSGTPNQANRINYDSVALGGLSQAYIDVLLTGKTTYPPKWMGNRPKDKRGWVCPLYHFVKSDPKGNVDKEIGNLASYKDKIWIDTFPAVAKYAQERDTAELATVKADDSMIELSLSDSMYDKLFTEPLTLKVRLPDAWKSVSAKQNGADITSKFFTHDGAPYALVYAVPDRGNIVITEK